VGSSAGTELLRALVWSPFAMWSLVWALRRPAQPLSRFAAPLGWGLLVLGAATGSGALMVTAWLLVTLGVWALTTPPRAAPRAPAPLIDTGTGAPPRRVVVGISPRDPLAAGPRVAWALGLVADGGLVQLVTAYDPALPGDEERARQVLQVLLDGARADRPGARLALHLAAGRASAVLLAAAEGADVVLLGGRDRSPVATALGHLVSGSTRRAVRAAARCPVVSGPPPTLPARPARRSIES